MFRLRHLILFSVKCRVKLPVPGQENCKTEKVTLETFPSLGCTTAITLARMVVSYLLIATILKAHDQPSCAC